MDVYLVRHGKAEPGADDASRRLTDGGHKAVAQVARALGKAHIRVERIEHSGLARARQTAEILHETVGGELSAVAGLFPDADVRPFALRLATERTASLMLVGHLPFMGRLAAALLSGDPDSDLLHFKTASIACLANDENAWQVEWLLNPDVV